LIPKDPLFAVKNKKPTRRDQIKKRMEYDEEEIKQMFSCPLFTGFKGKAHWGYREKPGDQIVRDAKFWLPILALWHGGRQDEFASARLSEIKLRGGIAYFDWKRRDLKTEESARELPIHPIMKMLGWDEYIEDLRQAGEEYIFPDLPHSAEKPKKAADRFSKWFGFWQNKNGFISRDFDFHAFRHTFQRACRDCDVDTHLSDLLTGRKTPGTATDYGKGASLAALARALAKVNFPQFPLADYHPPR
jgi:integrase